MFDESRRNGFVSGRGFSRAEKAQMIDRASAPAEWFLSN
jgi:hypothetical protein